jgi:hypothetical protein
LTLLGAYWQLIDRRERRGAELLRNREVRRGIAEIRASEPSA